jgi:hypothetical protein
VCNRPIHPHAPDDYQAASTTQNGKNERQADHDAVTALIVVVSGGGSNRRFPFT